MANVHGVGIEEGLDTHGNEPQGTTAARRRHPRSARDRLGDQFEELRAVLPKPPKTELTAKSQILEHSLGVMRDLMTRATNLSVELAVVTPEATHAWMRDVSDDGRKPLAETVGNVMKLFCWSRNWQYAEWWALDEQTNLSGPNADVFDPGRGGAEEVVSANAEVANPVTIGTSAVNGDAPENLQCCIIRDSVSVMRLARTLIDMRNIQPGNGQGGTDLSQFAKISRNYQFRPRDGMPGRVWTSRRAEWLPELDDSEVFRRSPLAREFGMKTCLAVPVVLGGQVHSVMAFYSTKQRAYDSTCHDLATTLAEALAAIYSPQPSSSGWDATLSKGP